MTSTPYFVADQRFVDLPEPQRRAVTLALMMFAAAPGSEDDKMAAALARADRFMRESEEHDIERLKGAVAALGRHALGEPDPDGLTLADRLAGISVRGKPL